MAKQDSEQRPTKLGRLRNVKVKHMDRLTNAEMKLVNQAFKYLRPINKLAGQEGSPFEQTPFQDVHNVRAQLASRGGVIKAVALYYGLKEEQVVNQSIMEFWHARNYVVAEAERLTRLEEKMLTREMDERFKNAGGEVLAAFGVFNSIDRVAQRYHLSPLEVEKWEYQLVFTVLWKMTVEDDIAQNLNSK